MFQAMSRQIVWPDISVVSTTSATPQGTTATARIAVVLLIRTAAHAKPRELSDTDVGKNALWGWWGKSRCGRLEGWSQKQVRMYAKQPKSPFPSTCITAGFIIVFGGALR
jgi:hypothetical protein